MSRTDHDILESVLTQRLPRNLLLIGSDANRLVVKWCQHNPQCEVVDLGSVFDVSVDSMRDRFDVAVLAGELTDQPRRQLEQLVAGLRDRYSEHLVIRLDATDSDSKDQPAAGTGLNIDDLRALGLRRLTGSERLFQFNLDDYKSKPDWLNSRYWANPDRWDKDRW